MSYRHQWEGTLWVGIRCWRAVTMSVFDAMLQFFFIYVLHVYAYAISPLSSLFYSQISGKSGNIYLVWGENISSDFLYFCTNKIKQNKMIRSNSLTETHQIRALCWSYEPIKQRESWYRVRKQRPLRYWHQQTEQRGGPSLLPVTLFSTYCSSVLYIR